MGRHYPPPWYAVKCVQIAQMVQWSGIGLMFFGPTLFQSLGQPEPGWLKTFQQNKMNAFVGMFFMNSFAGSMVSTGAFEVTIDGQLCFSKLASGRMPTAADMERGLESIGFVPGVSA